MTATTSAKCRPIIMSADSVRAILDGRKTMTRRVVKPSKKIPFAGALGWFANGAKPDDSIWKLCPLGQPGDLLWVRETWCGHWGPNPASAPGKNDAPKPERSVTDASVKQQDGSYAQATADEPLRLYYRSTFGDDTPLFHLKWASPIHMPRWASRITLRITAVRVERVQEISEQGASAEGCPHGGRGDLNSAGAEILEYKIEWFRRHWNSLNAKRGYSWESNPFVWVICFERAEPASLDTPSG